MNRILKQRARQLYGGNFGRTLVVYLVHLVYLVVPVLLPQLFQDWLLGEGFSLETSLFAILALEFLLIVLLNPIALGTSRYDYLLQKDRAPGIGEVFHYFTGPGRYGKAVAAGIIITWPSCLAGVFSSLQEVVWTGEGELLLSLLVIATMLFYLYWSLHVCLMRYILVEDETAQLGHIRRESFRLMKGNCGRYFGLEFSFLGWYLLILTALVVLGVALVVPAVVDLAMEGGYGYGYGYGFGFEYELEELLFPYILGIQMASYLLMTFLLPYVGLANAGFGDAALQGRLNELEWQGRMPYGGAYPGGPWQQPPYPPPCPPQYPPYPPRYPQAPQYPQPPQYPQGGPWQQGTASAQPQAPYTAAQEEEALQYQRYRQGQPMEQRTFSTVGCAEDLRTFRPWLQVEQSQLYSFLKLESWMPGMVAAVWQQALAGISPQALDSGTVVKRSLEESLSGTRFRVTVILSGYPARPGSYQVYLNIDLNPPA